MSERRKIIFHQGQLSEDDGIWDILYWNNLSSDTKLKEAMKMAINFHQMHNPENFSMRIDKSIISSGQISWQNLKN